MTAPGGNLDPRLHAYRPDLADARLKGRVEAARLVDGRQLRVTAVSAPLKRTPRHDAPLDTELLRGEVFRVFDETDEGWSWGQNETDSYVGYVPSEALGSLAPEPTHRVTALRTFVYPIADMKAPAQSALTMGSALAITAAAVEARGTVYLPLAGNEGFVVARHMAPLGAPPEPDFVAVAEKFLNTPYLWGGRTSLGLDCSALVQLALMMAGNPVPRDTDMQAATLGRPLPEAGALGRGDLLFWPGHVAIARSPTEIVHASGHHMTVVTEQLATALARIARTSGPPQARRL